MGATDERAVTIRSATDDDRDFLRSMLYEAAFWRPDSLRPPIESALAVPELRISVDGWRRPGDRGVIAVAGDVPLGAAWYRCYTPDDPCYGFVEPSIPVLSIAVDEPSRGKGVGRALLAALLLQARLDEVAAVSLSVEAGNPARRLYERFGFAPVDREGNAHTMLVRLGGPAAPARGTARHR